jgi:hypothetical protein
MAAGAVHGNGVIVGVDTGFHGTPFCRVRSARPPARAGATAASLGRERNHDYTPGREKFPAAGDDDNFYA